jgi:septal ring factor EnvC (AmiA/AmiB activator)
MAKTNTVDDFVAGIIGGLLVLIFACGLLGWLCGWSDPSAPLASDKGKIDIIVEEVENRANELAGNIKKVVRRPSMLEREAAQLEAEVAAQERAEAIQRKMAAARVAAAKDQMYEWEEGLFEEPAAAAAPSSNAPRNIDAR